MYSSKHIRLKYLSLFVVIIGAFTQLSIVSTVSEPTTDGKQFVILFWTKWFDKNLSGTLDNCLFTNCRTTANRQTLDESDAVGFHWRDIDVEDLPKPPKKSGQKWVLHNFEPPVYIAKYKIKPLVDYIDWTMTYRTDSDIYMPYYSVKECDQKWDNEDVLDTKTKSISWLVSNCKTPSNREGYVNELRAYIDVHIYGKCGQFCPRNKTCNQMVYNPYKFYLSFENSLCKDYVTEKFYRTLGYDIIPIVFGSADYEQMAPNHSYINTKDFSSPKELSEYLKEVSIDKNKYNSYLLWKRSQCVYKNIHYNFCGLCTKLNQMGSDSNSTKKTDLIDWWYDQAHCINMANITKTTVTSFQIYLNFALLLLLFLLK